MAQGGVSGLRGEVVLKRPRVKCLPFCMIWIWLWKVRVPQRVEKKSGSAVTAVSWWGRKGPETDQRTGDALQEFRYHLGSS